MGFDWTPGFRLPLGTLHHQAVIESNQLHALRQADVQ
jgi:hypothetical protein